MTNNLDVMHTGYAEALLWAEIPAGQAEDDGSTLEDAGFTVEDFSDEAWSSMRRDCERMAALIEEAGIVITDWYQAGADLYFTRQSHGTGYWDRADLYGKDGAAKLDKLVENNFSETYAWVDEQLLVQVETYELRHASDN